MSEASGRLRVAVPQSDTVPVAQFGDVPDVPRDKVIFQRLVLDTHAHAVPL